MYKQELIYYPDSFQIHIEKEYYNNTLIIETHFTIDGINFYYINYNTQILVKKFFFYDKQLDTFFNEYYYFISADLEHNDIKLKLHTKLKKEYHNVPRTKNQYSQTIDKTFILTPQTCTHLCTLNNDDAISYIQNNIKIQILEE